VREQLRRSHARLDPAHPAWSRARRTRYNRA
jgi:hypothetical protein